LSSLSVPFRLATTCLARFAMSLASEGAIPPTFGGTTIFFRSSLSVIDAVVFVCIVVTNRIQSR
jgi:hypothetical protein